MVIHVFLGARQLHHLVQPHGVDGVSFLDAGGFRLMELVIMR